MVSCVYFNMCFLCMHYQNIVLVVLYCIWQIHKYRIKCSGENEKKSDIQVSLDTRSALKILVHIFG